MKNKYTTIILNLFVAFVGIVSCDDMNEIQREYADVEERIYLGKVDSIKSIPGFGRAKVTWYIGADPKIEQTIIYWNQREDSLVKDFVRVIPGIQKDSIIIENLPEGSSLLEFRNVNGQGQSSLFTSASVSSWGSDFADGLRARKLTSTIFNYEQQNFTLELSSATVGDSVVYTEIVYIDIMGIEKTIRINRETNDIVLSNFSDGAEFRLRNVFFLPQGIDTVYSDYQVYRAPVAVFENGKKMSIAGNPASRYSEHNNTSLFEWNLLGDLILYELVGTGSFVQTEKYPELVSRDIYRDFFFYDDDKFVGIDHNNKVFMFQIENRELVYVKSGTNDYFGSGFDMSKFLPAKGFFYSITASGEMRSWFANNNATWGNPSNTTVDTDFIYEPFALFNYSYLVGIDAEGYLWSIPISTTGIYRGLNKIGSGWNKFVKLITVGEKLIAIDRKGEFYEFDFDANDYYWVIE